MRKLMHFTAGVAVGALAVMIFAKTPISATAPSMWSQISVDELQRSVDLKALPVLEVKEPF